MENTLFEGVNTRLPRDVLLKRMEVVIREALTPIQREILTAYYYDKQSQVQIARDRGLHKSTVCRTLHRAENRLRSYLKY